MELDKMTLELTWDELDILRTALFYLKTERTREVEVYQRRVEDPGPAPDAKETASYLLNETKKDLELLEQARLSIRNAKPVRPGKGN